MVKKETAKQTVKVLESELPELPLSIKAYGDGYRCHGITTELKTTVEDVVKSITENSAKTTLPLRNKKELISYLKKTT